MRTRCVVSLIVIIVLFTSIAANPINQTRLIPVEDTSCSELSSIQGFSEDMLIVADGYQMPFFYSDLLTLGSEYRYQGVHNSIGGWID